MNQVPKDKPHVEFYPLKSIWRHQSSTSFEYIFLYIQLFLKFLNVIFHSTLLFEIYQLAKEGVSLCMVIMCYDFLREN